MEFRYALSLLFSNMGQVLRILVWTIICAAITFGVGCAIVIPCWHIALDTTNIGSIYMQLKETISLYFNGDISFFAILHELMGGLEEACNELASNRGLAVGLTFGALFLYALYSFLSGLAFYPVADMVNKQMSSNMSFGFASNFVMNIKKSVKYSLARLSMTFPLDLICFIIEMCVIFGLFPSIKFFAFTIALLIFIVYVANRITCFAGWLPRLLYYPDEKIYVNFFRSLTAVKHNYSALFKSLLITISIVYLCACIFALPTFGLLSVVMPPIYYYLIRAIELVGYYKTNGMSFYIDSTNVIDTVEYGYRKKNQGE